MNAGTILAWIGAVLVLLLALLLAAYVLRLARRRALARAAGKAPAADAGPVAAASGLVPAVRAACAGREEESSPAYAAPLVLLAGEREAARSALEYGGEGADGPLCWHATPQGWVLYADMPAFGFTSEQDNEGWQALAEELERRRPRRPVDAVMLAVPADALCGPDAWPPLELERRAALARRRVGELQRLFGLRLPVYLLLTHCERLEGFGSFVAALPPAMRDAMLGWSNPFDPELPYEPAWLDAAFAQLSRGVTELQAELAAAGAPIADSDAFFLLPGAIARLAAPAGQYAERLLGDDAHSVSPMLRGLYLCGAGAAGGDGMPERPWFAADLLAQKVFPERGLAFPLRGQILSRNRKVRRWAAACAVLLVVWGGALAWGHVSLKGQADRLAATLVSIREEQEHRARERAKAGHMEYGEYKLASQNIVDAMLVRQSSLSQPAMPASWKWTGAQDLDERIESQFGQALSNIVYRTLNKGLNLVVEQQTGTRLQPNTLLLPEDAACQVPAPTDKGELSSSAVLADTAAFNRLERYVADAALFEQARKHMDNLLGKGNYEDLVKVAAFTDAFQVPSEAQRGASPLLVAALKQQYQPENADEQRARQQKSILCAFHEEHQQFLARMVDRHPALVASRTVAEQLHGGSALSNEKNEQSLIPALQQLSRWLAAPTVQWLDDAESGEGRAYGELLRKVQANTLLGPGAADWARAQRAQHVKALQQALVHPAGAAHAVLQRSADGRLALTPELANLQAGLERLARQPFMAEAVVPPGLQRQGAGPLWDLKKLNAALLQGGEARSYLEKEIPGFPAPFQPELQRYTGQRLADTLLAAAGASLGAGSNEAETYQRLGQAQKPLTALLEMLASLDADHQHRVLATALATQANEGLRWLERDLLQGGLYQPRDGSFDWWQGSPNPAAQAFAGGDPQGLEDYLLSQQTRIESAVRQAQPLLRLLEAAQGHLNSGPARQWSELAADLARYQDKQPNARMAQLHAFIRGDLAAADGGKCLGAPGTTAAGGAGGAGGESPLLAQARYALPGMRNAAANGGDLFSERRRWLGSALASRCLVLARADAEQDYRALREQFRRTLAGRFPFADASHNGDAAQLEDVQSYLRLIDQLAPESQRMAQGRARDFVAASTALRQFLAPVLPSVEGADSAGYLLAVRFRVGANGEADGHNALAGELGGNRIAAWSLQSGDETISWDSSAKGAPQNLPWRPGMPLVLTLRWADNVAQLPVEDGSDRYLSVAGRQAVYRFNEPWALLRLLARHSVPGTAARPSVLRFELPTSGGGPRTRVFLRLAVMPAQKKEVLAYPVFPTAVPGDEPPRLLARP